MLERIGFGATRALAALGLALLMALAALTLADGLMRWLANRPIEGVRDAGALVVAIAVACCLPVGLMERSNVTIRVAGTLLGARAGRALDALAALAAEAVIAAMAWQFTVFAGKVARAGETTWILKIPTAPFWYVVAAIFWIAVAVQAIVILVELRRLRS